MTPNINKIIEIKEAYDNGELGSERMPEDSHPEFDSTEHKLAYFTLPMALNYQRNSYKLWEAAQQTYEDHSTKIVFNVNEAATLDDSLLREKLLKYKLALQPNTHIKIWKTLSTTFANYEGLENFISTTNRDFLKLREIIQQKQKKNFPYLSGPKIFNYWAHILERYCDITWTNREYIEIAPDTHVIQASISLGVLTEQEAEAFTREQISARWREVLKPLGIAPIDMHSPLWFWNRKQKLEKEN